MRRRATGTARVLATAAALLAATGCAKGGADAPTGPADATYSTRGQVMELPSTAGGELAVHHEAVPDFRDSEGKPEHMESMSMPFAVANDVSLAGIAPGDKVAITFEVRWNAQPALRVVKLEELPESTALDLGGPTLELVAPLGSGKTTAKPTPGPTPAPSERPAGDGGSPPPSSTI